jgi:hypothetical protein
MPRQRGYRPRARPTGRGYAHVVQDKALVLRSREEKLGCVSVRWVMYACIQTCESGDHDSERTAIACDVYVAVRVLEARSNMKIWPLSTDNATREPSGLYTASIIYRKSTHVIPT